jgi:galactokinase
MDTSDKPSRDLENLLARVHDVYRQRFSGAPHWTVCAPGRVNLIGEHVDSNQGFVLPMAIERHTVIAAGPRSAAESGAAATVRVYSVNLDDLQEISLPARGAPRKDGWSAYVQGVLAGYEERSIDAGPLDLVVGSSVPLGGGLSSSAALEVAVATLVETVAGTSLDPLEKIRLCQWAEHTFAGVPCGIMDQFATTLAQANKLMLLDCRSLKTTVIPLDPPAPTVLIVNSNVRHELGTSQYAVRRQECERATAALGVESLRDVSFHDLTQTASHLDATVFRRARHVVSEIQRTCETAQAIQRREWQRAGEKMYESHASLRDDYEVSCQELDLLVDLARQLGMRGGVYGSRMTGGGFGGCTVSLVEPRAVPEVVAWLRDKYRDATGIEPAMFVTRPAAGARRIAV